MPAALHLTEVPVEEARDTRPADTSWMSRATCRVYPPAMFFPSDGVGVIQACAVCRNCPVAEECLEYALSERVEHGVWGGRSERERRRILKRRSRESAA